MEDPLSVGFMKLKRWMLKEAVASPSAISSCMSKLELLQAVRNHGVYAMTPPQLEQLAQMEHEQQPQTNSTVEQSLDADITKIQIDKEHAQTLITERPDSGQILVPRVGRGPTLRIVVISDTHNHHDEIQVPPGDILIHCGDFTNKGKAAELTAFNEWLGQLPHRHKFLVVGNHEVTMFNEWDPALVSNALFVDNSLVEVEGVRLYGMPWKGELAASKRMPANIDVLFTHEPPCGILDGSNDSSRGHRGNEFILELIKEKLPRVVVYGHVHPSGGVEYHDGIAYANCAIASDKGFTPKKFENPVHWFDIDGRV